MPIFITPHAEKSLKKINKLVAQQLLKEFMVFSEDKNWWKNPKVKALAGMPFYRYKSGNFRIIFDQAGTLFEIYDVKQRNESTYKNL